jgi:SAM-dependent methyltransferase
VVAVEADPRQRDEALRLARVDGEADLLDLRAGDAARMPLEEAEWGTFDVVHARFLLEHVGDPAPVVAEMVRAARPGGRIVLEDDDHDVLRVWPEPPGFATLWAAYMGLFHRRGCQPDIGRRMVALLYEAGAEPVANDWLFFGGCAGDDRFDALVVNFAGLLEGARDALLGDGLVDAGDLDRGIEAWRAWGRRADASLWYAWAWAEGRRRDGG